MSSSPKRATTTSSPPSPSSKAAPPKVAGLDGPIYFSGSYAVPGSPHLRQRSFVAERGQLLSLSITTEPANSSARPLDWKRGDVRSSGDRSGWEISWRSQAPLLARAADQLTGSLRYRSATRIIDRRPRDDYPWQLRAGDRVPSGLRTRELPGGLWKSAHRGRIISVR